MAEERPVRTTYPGRREGIVAWSDADIDRLEERVRSDGDLWQRYLALEDKDGLITDEMNYDVLEHAARLFPEYLGEKWRERTKLGFNKSLQALVVDFRFRNFIHHQFGLWQPGKIDERMEKRSAHIRVHTYGKLHGVVEWSDSQAQTVIDHIARINPEFFGTYNWRMDHVGFSDVDDVLFINRQGGGVVSAALRSPKFLSRRGSERISGFGPRLPDVETGKPRVEDAAFRGMPGLLHRRPFFRGVVRHQRSSR